MSLPFDDRGANFPTHVRMTLKGGLVCKFAPGGTSSIAHSRLNYTCEDGSFLYGGLAFLEGQVMVARLQRNDWEVWRACLQTAPTAVAPPHQTILDECDHAAIRVMLAVVVESESPDCYVSGFQPPRPC
jgi:hypothetical protein